MGPSFPRSARTLARVALLAPALALGACEKQARPRSEEPLQAVSGSAGDDAAPAVGAKGENAEAASWPYWPVRLRIHPLSRIVRSAGAPLLIEARIEFLDQDDNTSRGFGQLRIDLYDGARGALQKEQLQVNQDLRDLELNRRHFDVVTRTYLFRIEVPENELPAEPELRAYFLAADGRRLNQATLRLRTS
jgi:hypothetical protein